MFKLNRSKAGHYTAEPILTCPLKPNEYMDNFQSSVFHSMKARHEIVEKHIRYINESIHDISVIDGSGITITIPSTNRRENRLVVCIQLTWSGNTYIDWTGMVKHYPGLDAEMEALIDGAIVNRNNTSPKELNFYYVVKLDDIEHDPYGIWIEALNVQVVSKEHLKKTTFFTRDCFFHSNDEKYEMENIIWNTTTAITYFVEDESITTSVYLPFGDDLLEVKPIYMPGMKQGIHLNLRGKVNFAARRDNVKSMFIAEEDFKKYGFYTSIRDWRETVKDSTKGCTKEEVTKRMACFDKFHSHLFDEEIEPLVIKDVSLFGNFTVGSLLEFLESLAKADSLLDKILHKK